MRGKTRTPVTAFLKIDRCASCDLGLPWEWVPPVTVGSRTLAGTGVWRSALTDGRCPACVEAESRARRRESWAERLRADFSRLVGGPRPCREFTFERYRVTAGNRSAFEKARAFEPAKDNLYLWGACGGGKTHLAVATLRRRFANGASIVFTTPSQLVRQLRMRPPEDEQQAIDRCVNTDVLVIDDLGVGGDTAFGRQILQEILDGRDFNDRGGLIVTSQHSPEGLARRWNDRAVPSRLAGMCQVIHLTGPDHRPTRRCDPPDGTNERAR
jgi:DNA replication protein DnaC